MSCVVCESYGVQLRPAVDVLVVPYSVRLHDSLSINYIFGDNRAEMSGPLR